MKTQLNETIDLMQRMHLFEGAIPRKQVSRDEIIDMLNQQDTDGAGTWVCFTYVKPQSFYKTKRNWRKDDVTAAISNYSREGNESWYDTINNFNNDDNAKTMKGIDGIIVTTRYNCHWTTPDSYAKAYDKYSSSLHDLRMRNGVGIQSDGMLGDNHNQKEKFDYGAQANQTGNLSKDFNLAGMNKPKSTCYVVGADGSIKGGIGGDMIKAMNKIPDYTPKPEKDVAEALADNPEALKAYMDAKAELDKSFSPKNFLFDRILSIVATVNGIAYYYINDALKSAIADKSDIYVNPQEMQKIAMEQLSDSVEDIMQNYDPLKQ